MLLARARLSRRLRRANIPSPAAPYRADAWCEAIGRERGRDLRVQELRLGVDLPPGLLIRRRQEDIIVVDDTLPELTRTQTILHEVAHLVLDHDGDVLHDDIDPAVEAEAEAAADVLSRWLTSAGRAAPAALQRDAAVKPPAWLGPAWLADRRADWHLLQLWTTLRDGIPDAAIVSTSTAVPAPTEISTGRQRHRTVIEVLEVLRLLQPWCSPRVHDSASQRARRHGLGPEAVTAVADAATIAVALRHRRTSQPPMAGGAPALDTRHDVSSEARRLARMACALHDSPLVMAEIARWIPTLAAADAEVSTHSAQHEPKRGGLPGSVS
ncbi:DUF6545 domain-containing protein [Micromonospora sp. NPDC003241]